MAKTKRNILTGCIKLSCLDKVNLVIGNKQFRNNALIKIEKALKSSAPLLLYRCYYLSSASSASFSISVMEWAFPDRH